MQRAIVTGGAGFIGSNIVRELYKKGTKVTVVDWFNPDKEFCKGKPQNLQSLDIEIINRDIRQVNWSELFDKYKPDAVFHDAAIAITTIHDEDEMMSVNLGASMRLIRAAVERNIPVVYASSAAVYGHEPSPNSEEGCHTPANIYGDSKYVLDRCVLRIIEKNQNAKIVGLRYFNIYGPGEDYKGNMASMIHQLFHQMNRGERPAIFPDGTQSRDFVYVKDVVAINMLAATSGKSGIFNVGTGKANSYNAMIKHINEALGTHLEIDYVSKGKAPAFFQSFTQADTRLAKEKLGFTTKFSFRDGIHDYVNYLKNSPEHASNCQACKKTKK